MLVRLLIAALLLGHAMIHTGFLAPRPQKTAGGPPWPFELDRSWILDALGIRHEIGRLVGVALVAVTLGGFAFAAVAVLGIGPAGLWPAAAGVGAVGSLAALVLFFHPWLVVGVAIDLALLSLWILAIVGFAGVASAVLGWIPAFSFTPLAIASSWFRWVPSDLGA